MSITKIQVMSQSMLFGNATISTTGFANTPKQGNTLIMYLAAPWTLGVTSVRSENIGTGGQNWSLCTSVALSGIFFQVWVNYYVPPSIGKTITLNTGISTSYYFSTIEEVAGLTSVKTSLMASVWNQQNVINSGNGANFSTIATSPTLFPYEYWVNAYIYQNPQNGDAILSTQSPYKYFGSSPIVFNGTGTTSWSGSSTPFTPSISAGMYVADTVSNFIGINSGIVTDSGGTASNWVAVSLTFFGLPKKTVTTTWIS